MFVKTMLVDNGL